MTTLQRLIEEYGYWAEDPDHPLSAWKEEVNKDETRLGYWDWVEKQVEDNFEGAKHEITAGTEG